MPSGPMERLRQLDDAFGVRIPALGRVRVIVQIAAHPHEPRTFREGEMAAHGWTRHVGVEFGQLCAIDEGGAPLLLDMGAAVEHIVRMGVRVAAEPKVDRARLSLAALSVPTWQSLMTQRLNLLPSWRNSA